MMKLSSQIRFDIFPRLKISRIIEWGMLAHKKNTIPAYIATTFLMLKPVDPPLQRLVSVISKW